MKDAGADFEVRGSYSLLCTSQAHHKGKFKPPIYVLLLSYQLSYFNFHLRIWWWDVYIMYSPLTSLTI